MLQSVCGFDKSNLKHAETQEKNVLPNAADVVKDKRESSVILGVEEFDKTELKHAGGWLCFSMRKAKEQVRVGQRCV